MIPVVDLEALGNYALENPLEALLIVLATIVSLFLLRKLMIKVGPKYQPSLVFGLIALWVTINTYPVVPVIPIVILSAFSALPFLFDFLIVKRRHKDA